MSHVEWRKIDGWPYEVSSEGQVRRCEPTQTNTQFSVGYVLKPMNVYGKCKTPYVRVILRIGKRYRCATIHRLVAEAFLGERPSEQHQVNHKNGIKTDNRPHNLEWVTCLQNIRHAWAIGLMKKQRKRGKLSAEQRDKAREMVRSGATFVATGKEFGVHPDTIGLLWNGKTWAEG